MEWKYECTISFESRHADAVVHALSHGNGYERCTSEVSCTGNRLFVRMRAKDITALRASMNDYARLIRVCEYADAKR